MLPPAPVGRPTRGGGPVRVGTAAVPQIRAAATEGQRLADRCGRFLCGIATPVARCAAWWASTAAPVRHGERGPSAWRPDCCGSSVGAELLVTGASAGRRVGVQRRTRRRVTCRAIERRKVRDQDPAVTRGIGGRAAQGTPRRGAWRVSQGRTSGRWRRSPRPAGASVLGRRRRRPPRPTPRSAA